MLLVTLNQLLSYFDWLKTFHWLPVSFRIKAKNPSSGSLPDLPSYFSILISSTTLLLIHSSLFTVALFLGLTHAKHNLSYLRVFAQTIPSSPWGYAYGSPPLLLHIFTHMSPSQWGLLWSSCLKCQSWHLIILLYFSKIIFSPSNKCIIYLHICLSFI